MRGGNYVRDSDFFSLYRGYVFYVLGCIFKCFWRVFSSLKSAF